METIEVIIDTDGGVRVATQGFAGPACALATRAIEKALGTVTTDTPTAEMALTGQRHTVSQR